MTIDLENEVFSTDDILSDLQISDRGNLINLKDLKTIISDTNERLYEWLHNWAGLYLDIQKPFSMKEANQVPTFKFDEESSTISTKLIISRIWQRLVSKSVLSLQINNLVDNKQILPEVLAEFKTVKEFQMLSNSIKGVIKDFKKISSSIFEIVIERDRAYEVHARIKIPQNYPDCPPSFNLTMQKHSFNLKGN